MNPILVWKFQPFRSSGVAGTWACAITVMFDLGICQIAGCKKENSLITTHVQSSTLNEPDCAFLIMELLGAYELLLGH